MLAAACANQQGSPGQGGSASVPKNTLPAGGIAPSGGAPLPVQADDQIRIGFLAPLSGPQESVGKALLNAAQMAVFDQPRARLVLLPRDTAGRADGAAAAANAAAVEGAVLLVGPLFAESTRAATPVARSRGIGVISFSSNSEVAGNGVYILGFTPGEQAERIVRHAVQAGLNRIAVLAPDNAYGTTVVQGAQRAAGQLGATIAQTELYRPDGASIPEAVATLAGSSAGAADLAPDAILIADGGERLRLIARSLKSPTAPAAGGTAPAASTARLLGTGLWDDPGLQREQALLGGWFATAPPDLAASFAQRYSAVYGEEPPKVAALAYDAVALAAALAQRPQTSPGEKFSRLALEDPEGYVGYGGIFRLNPNGTAERGLAVLEVTPNGFLTVAPPPERFTTPAGS